MIGREFKGCRLVQMLENSLKLKRLLLMPVLTDRGTTKLCDRYTFL